MITASANESEAPLTARVPSIQSRAAATPTALGVFVVGMHRSGTSATTRMLNLLGLPLCRDDDLVQDSVGNPSGHWESASLVQFNDRLLWTIGASWWCPQRPNATWVGEPLVAPALRAAPTIFAAGHAGPQWAWKDPRTSLTLPFWLTALDVKPLVVLCTRNPLEVAHSLRTRNAMEKPLSLALWERYTHTIVNAIDGLPVLVTRYEDLMRDPDFTRAVKSIAQECKVNVGVAKLLC